MDGIEAPRPPPRGGARSPGHQDLGHGDIALAVSAVQGGAFDFLEKPLDQSGSWWRCGTRSPGASWRREPASAPDPAATATPHRDLGRARRGGRIVAKAAPTDARVLVPARTARKELVAHQLHLLSKRAARPFVAVNCAAIPQELIESELFAREGRVHGRLRRPRRHFERRAAGRCSSTKWVTCRPAPSRGACGRSRRASFTKVGGSLRSASTCASIAATNKDLAKDVRGGLVSGRTCTTAPRDSRHARRSASDPRTCPAWPLHFSSSRAGGRDRDQDSDPRGARDDERQRLAPQREGAPEPRRGLVVLTEAGRNRREHVLSLARPREESVPGDLYSIPDSAGVLEDRREGVHPAQAPRNGWQHQAEPPSGSRIQRSNLSRARPLRPQIAPRPRRYFGS